MIRTVIKSSALVVGEFLQGDSGPVWGGGEGFDKVTPPAKLYYVRPFPEADK